MTRRKFIQKYGIYGTTLPMSISILFQPSFSHAACSDAGTSCTFDWECCSGDCHNNGKCR